MAPSSGATLSHRSLAALYVKNLPLTGDLHKILQIRADDTYMLNIPPSSCRWEYQNFRLRQLFVCVCVCCMLKSVWLRHCGHVHPQHADSIRRSLPLQLRHPGQDMPGPCGGTAHARPHVSYVCSHLTRV